MIIDVPIKNDLAKHQAIIGQDGNLLPKDCSSKKLVFPQKITDIPSLHGFYIITAIYNDTDIEISIKMGVTNVEGIGTLRDTYKHIDIHRENKTSYSGYLNNARTVYFYYVVCAQTPHMEIQTIFEKVSPPLIGINKGQLPIAGIKAF